MVKFDDNYTDALVDLTTRTQKKLRTADDVISEIKESVDAIGPVESLEKLVKDYRGNTIYDKIKDYILCGGHPLQFYNIIQEQNTKYMFYKNNLKSMGAKSFKNDIKRKKINKVRLRALISALIITLGIITGVVSYNVTKVAEREQEFAGAVDLIEDTYIVEQTGIYNEGLEAVDISVLNDVDPVDFAQYLEDNGFGKYEIIYLTSEILGKQGANIVCENYGDKDLDTFLENYFFDSVTSYDSSTIFQKHPSYKKLSNWVEESIKKKAANMKDILEGYKTGLRRGL